MICRFPIDEGAEVRQRRTTLARLLPALRVPADEPEDQQNSEHLHRWSVGFRSLASCAARRADSSGTDGWVDQQ